jgi:hypothetical protein
MKRNFVNFAVAALVAMPCTGMTGCKRADHSSGTQDSSTGGLSAPAAGSSDSAGGASAASQ